MRFSSFRYLVKQGWKAMAHNRLMTLASIGVLTACFIITGMAALVSINVSRMVDTMASGNKIIVNTLLELDDSQIAAVGEQITSMQHVEDVEFLSREYALELMQESLEDYGPIMEGIDPAIFPAKYRVTVDDPDFMDWVVQNLSQMAGVERVYVSSELTDVMLTIKDFVTYGGGGLVVVLLLVSLIVISNTIRLTVFNRRKEISIMKYVGATNGFIRMPFFVEGMTVGILAGLLASAVVCGGYYLIYGYLHDMYNVWVMGMIGSLYKLGEVWPYVVGVFVAVGAVMGGFGTGTAVRKHLKV